MATEPKDSKPTALPFQHAGGLLTDEDKRVDVYGCPFCGALVTEIAQHIQHHSEMTTALTTMGDVIQTLIWQRLGLPR
jgi:hypothetical protein